MLEELLVTDLGVIERLSLTFGPGMTALTGETGAGKTMVVGAIGLLLGGRADPMLVRPGAEEATVEGRFTLLEPDGTEREIVVRRVVPREGRSRSYVNGNLASAQELTALGARLVDVHGQHAHQSLLQPAAQRAALDRFGAVDVAALRSALAEVAELDRGLEALGGDDRARAREADLLRFQLDEIDGAHLDDPDEDAALEAEEDRLADAVAHQEAAARAHGALADDGGALERLGEAIAALRDRSPFAAIDERARGFAAELSELAAELRDLAEALEPDPDRLEEVRRRRRLLRELCRKYGDTVEAVLVEGDRLRARLAEIDGHAERASELQVRRAEALERLAAAQHAVGAARRAAATPLAAAVHGHLADLALGKARLDVVVGDPAADPAGDEVTFLLAANPGAPLLPLAKVASGGELARTMLALRLVLSELGRDGEGDGPAGSDGGSLGPPTQIFDEVDAGIGGAAATAVGRALARLGRDRQVLVVTHLAQVAAWAQTQVTVEKRQGDDVTVSVARRLTRAERLVELARMLSGSPDSKTARKHAAELLDAATSAGTDPA